MLFAGLGFALIYVVIALLIAGSFHEASHALVAYWLGDNTPKETGRLSLNPFAHVDPVGAMMILVAGLGWFKPVLIKAENLRPGPKIGMALVAIAGPISNFLLAGVIALPLRLHWLSYAPEPIFEFNQFKLFIAPACVLETIVSLSLALAFFNLIPISPLDGSRIWQIVLPEKWYWAYARYEVLGILLIVGLILVDRFVSPTLIGTSVLSDLLSPPMNFAWRPLVGFGSPFSCVIAR